MDNTTSSSSNASDSASLFSPKFELGYIRNQVKTVVLNPGTCWQVIKAQPETIGDVYGRFLVFLAAIPPLSMFLSGLAEGGPFFTLFFSGILQYVIGLGLIYIFAWVMELLAPLFEGRASRTEAFRLLAYSNTPNFIGGILHVIKLPGIRWVMLGISLYSLYLLYTGIQEMVEVPESRRLTFFGAFMLTVLLAIFFIVPAVFSLFDLHLR